MIGQGDAGGEMAVLNDEFQRRLIAATIGVGELAASKRPFLMKPFAQFLVSRNFRFRAVPRLLGLKIFATSSSRIGRFSKTGRAGADGRTA